MYKIAKTLHKEQTDFVNEQFDKLIKEFSAEIINVMKNDGKIILHRYDNIDKDPNCMYIKCDVLIDDNLEKKLVEHINDKKERHDNIFFTIITDKKKRQITMGLA